MESMARQATRFQAASAASSSRTSSSEAGGRQVPPPVSYAEELARSAPKEVPKPEGPLAPDLQGDAAAMAKAFGPGARGKLDDNQKDGEKIEGAAQQQALKSEGLPAEVRAAFPDVDLSDVSVIHDSPEAAKAGALAYTEGSVIRLLNSPCMRTRRPAARVCSMAARFSSSKRMTPASCEAYAAHRAALRI